MGESTSPISVILVSSGSRGNKLLFRFPFQRGPEHPAAQAVLHDMLMIRQKATSFRTQNSVH